MSWAGIGMSRRYTLLAMTIITTDSEGQSQGKGARMPRQWMEQVKKQT
jgi:hypothetical protein